MTVFLAGVVVVVGVVAVGVVVVGVVVVGVVAVGDGEVVAGEVVVVGVGAGLVAKYPATPATTIIITIIAAITDLDTPNLSIRPRSATSMIYSTTRLNNFYCI